MTLGIRRLALHIEHICREGFFFYRWDEEYVCVLDMGGVLYGGISV